MVCGEHAVHVQVRTRLDQLEKTSLQGKETIIPGNENTIVDLLSLLQDVPFTKRCSHGYEIRDSLPYTSFVSEPRTWAERHNLAADESLSFFTQMNKSLYRRKKNYPALLIPTMASPRSLSHRLRPHISTMPAKMKAIPVTIVAPGGAHAELPAEGALASALSGLESANTEWPGLEMWPSGATTLDDAWNEGAATLLRKDALTKTGSAESAVAYRAPMCDKHTHPSVPCLDSPSRLLMDFTVSSSAAEFDQNVDGWDAIASSASSLRVWLGCEETQVHMHGLLTNVSH